MNCKICGQSTQPFQRGMLLAKHEVQYFRCPDCGFMQTEEPYWLDEAYANPINASDVGLVGRNLLYARWVKSIIFLCRDRKGSFLDYGGGHGLFVRLMRDTGLDFRWYDARCPNLFARGFAAKMQGETYELLTAFEVFEHLINPLDEIERMLALSKNLLFSTRLVPRHTPRLEEWWYYGLDHGQHVAFYTRAALSEVAKRFGLRFHTTGRSLHLLTAERISPARWALVSRYQTALPLSVLLHRRSLQPEDYKSLGGGVTR